MYLPEYNRIGAKIDYHKVKIKMLDVELLKLNKAKEKHEKYIQDLEFVQTRLNNRFSLFTKS